MGVILSTDRFSSATNTADRSVSLSAGEYSYAEVSGKNSVAIAPGIDSRARASAGSAIVLCYRDDYEQLLHIRSAIAAVGGEVLPNVWYQLNAAGEFVQVEGL